MTWWNRKSKPEDEPMVLLPKEPEPGQIVPCDDPEKVLAKFVTILGTVKVKPPPDMSAKPADIVGYCFGFVCPKKHVNSTFENITVDGYKERKVCQKCGGVSKPAVVKRTEEPKWGNLAELTAYCSKPEPKWGWYNSYAGIWFNRTLGYGDPLWNKHEFVHFLDEPKPRKTVRRKK